MQNYTNHYKSRLHEYNTLYYLLDGDMSKFLNSKDALNFEKTSYLFSTKVMIDEMNNAFKASVQIKAYLNKVGFGEILEGYVCSEPVMHHTSLEYRTNSNPADIVVISKTKTLGISLKSIAQQKNFINHKTAPSSHVPNIHSLDYETRKDFIMAVFEVFGRMNSRQAKETMEHILHLYNSDYPTIQVSNILNKVYISQIPGSVKTMSLTLATNGSSIHAIINGKFEYKIYAYRRQTNNVRWDLDIRKKVK